MKNLLPTLFVIIITIISCNPSEPENDRELTLKVEDVSCTEAWLNIQTNNISLPAQINVTANSQPVNQHTLTTSDSLIIIDSLKPNSSYTFQATISNNISSNTVNDITMDTTSHNFVWETFSFGEHSSSILYDVAIIDENNIWAVGEIYIKDSLEQPDPYAYNAIHWDGQRWELKRINMQSSCNPVTYPLLKTISSFSENNIVVSSGGSIGWFDGIVNLPDCSIRPLLTGSLNKLWGTGSNNIYAVGNEGNIVYYNGNNWQKFETETEIDLNNICSTSESNKIWISGSSVNNFESILLEVQNNQVNKLWENITGGSKIPPYGKVIHGIYSTNNNLYLLSDEGVFRKKIKLDLPVEQIRADFQWRKYCLSGETDNKIFTVGSSSKVWQFNGIGWAKVYENNENISSLYSVKTKEGVTIAVGTEVIDAVFHKAVLIKTN
ncbi:MAG: glucosyl transferase [Ignavibacteriae bacterium]|nr:glucosyl transferase [Ignavibacteriota bacterium]NOG97340.1 glucosyl transferase [Ignavibacteriota bacterium]